jgi:hypothetical protein
MSFYETLISMIQKRFGRVRVDVKAVRAYVRKLIKDERFQFVVNSDGTLSDYTHYGALLMRGIKVPRSVISNSLYVRDGDIYYSWFRGTLVANKYSDLDKQLNVGHWFTVSDGDRLQIKVSSLEEEYERKVLCILT